MRLRDISIFLFYVVEIQSKSPNHNLWLEEAYDITITEPIMQRPILKKLDHAVFSGTRRELVIPEDYEYREDFTTEPVYRKTHDNRRKTETKRRRLKPKPGRRKYKFHEMINRKRVAESTELKPRPTKSPSSSSKSSVYSEYIWEVWPTITRSGRLTTASVKTKTLASYFPTIRPKNKTKLWREDEWSRGPTGPDDIYYNFYKDFYVSDHVGKLNTYIGTPPRCHTLGFKVDGQIVNAPVHEQLYDDAFRDYLKDRVKSYSTWSAYVKANPCFTTLTKFYGTTKILALFAARPRMSAERDMELYRKDYIVMTQENPIIPTSRNMGPLIRTRPPKKTITVKTIATDLNVETIDEAEFFNKLKQSEKDAELLPIPKRGRNWFGPFQTRMFNVMTTTDVLMNMEPPEQWVNQFDENWDKLKETVRRKTTDDEKLLLRTTKSVLRKNKQKFDVKVDKPASNSHIMCFDCVEWVKGIPKMTCYNIFESRDQRLRGRRLGKYTLKCVHQTGTSMISDQPRVVKKDAHRHGCYHRFLDVPSPYDDRSCRHWPPDITNSRHFASKRYARLEKLLRYTEDGCVASPMAVLTPFARGVSLGVR